MDEIPGKYWLADDGHHIDVRGLFPPEPLVAILMLIGHPDISPPIIVHHDRDPIYLYPELHERGWTSQAIEGDTGEIRLKLTKAC